MTSKEMPKPGKVRHVLRGYLFDLIRIDARDPARRRVFARQVDAGAKSLRWMAVPGIINILIVAALFWDISERWMLGLGAALVTLSSASSLILIPKSTNSEAPRSIAVRRTVLATCASLGWAFATSAIDQQTSASIALLIVAIQVAMICIGFVINSNLPVAFFAFSGTMTLTIMIGFGVKGGTNAVTAILLASGFFLILAKAMVDQSRMFVAAAMTSEELIAMQEVRRESEIVAEAERRRVADREARAMALATQARHDEMVALAIQFEASVVGVVDNVTRAVSQLSTSSEMLDAMAQNTAAAAGDVAQQATISSDAITTLATAANQLAVSIAQIADQIGDHAVSSNRALSLATSSEDAVHAMSRDAARVNDVVAMIDDLTKQTNLLALNATIEAARAGDAGLGFAVVASEVKSLATRAGNATQEVGIQIDRMTGGIGSTVESIQSVANEIDAVSRIATAIAASIGQQRLATDQIGIEAEIVANNAKAMRDRMTQLATGVGSAGALTRGLAETAQALAADANALRGATGDFLGFLRAA